MYEKKNKTLKVLVSVLSVVLVMCLTVAGTLAYLKVKTEPVVNTFAPSNIDLTLKETERTYKMIPGIELEKDPQITVTADIDCFVFVKVAKSDNFDTYMTYATAAGWTLVSGETNIYYREVSATEDEDQNGNTNVEAFYVLAGNETYENGFVAVKNSVEKTDMTAANDNKPTLTFTAYAIQKEGFTTPAAAWAEAQEQQANS